MFIVRSIVDCGLTAFLLLRESLNAEHKVTSTTSSITFLAQNEMV